MAAKTVEEQLKEFADRLATNESDLKKTQQGLAEEVKARQAAETKTKEAETKAKEAGADRDKMAEDLKAAGIPTTRWDKIKGQWKGALAGTIVGAAAAGGGVYWATRDSTEEASGGGEM